MKERWTRRRVLQTYVKFAAASALFPLAAACAPPETPKPPTPKELSTADRLGTAKAVIEEATQVVDLKTAEAQIEELKMAQAKPTQGPTKPPTPEPTPTTKPTVAAKLEPSPSPKPTRAKPDIPELTPSQQATQAKTEQVRPTSTPEKKEAKIGKIWEVQVLETPLTRYDGKRGPSPPSFAWNGRQLFATLSSGIPVEIDLLSGQEKWRWLNQGIIMGTYKNIVYLLRRDAPRIYALISDDKTEKWKYNIPQDLLPTTNNLWTYQLRWPIISSEDSDFLAIQLDRQFLFAERVAGAENVRLGRVIMISGNKMVTSVLKPPGIYTMSVFDLAKSFDNPVFEIDATARWTGITHVDTSITDKDMLVLSLADFSPQAKRTKIMARDLETNKIAWERELMLGTRPYSIHKNFIVAMVDDLDRRSRRYFLLSRSDGRPVKEFETQDVQNYEVIEYKFFGDEHWFFASHLRQGTFAWFDDKFVWENDEVLGADEFLGEVDSNLILARTGGKFGADAPVWAVEKTKGQKFAWKPSIFDQLTAPPIRIGDTAVVASSGTLHTLDLKTGQLQMIISGNVRSPSVEYLVSTNRDRLVIGQISGQVKTLFAAAV